ncbi:flavocytochrome c [Christensenellaceae bacterium OttesenSCG-928-M15]|nr:flavocytochrome c [Christensenellaceae bacterium OttesenSCG-928-M15]
MKKSVRLISLLLLCALLFTACSNDPAPAQQPEALPVETAAAEAPLFTPGTYTATVPGKNADITVEVTVGAQAIEDISIGEHNETAGIAEAAFEKIPAAVIATQSLAVDAVAGATVTSEAVLLGIETCLVEAGADIAALKQAQSGTAASAGQIEKAADVIIIGAGGAGMSAATTAALEGASVIVVEKMPMIGGNTILAGGAYNAADPALEKNNPMTDGLKATVQDLIDMEPHDDRFAYWQGELKADYEAYLASGEEGQYDGLALHILQTYSGGDYEGDIALIEAYCQYAMETNEWLQSIGLKWQANPVTKIGSLWPRCHMAEGYDSGKAYIDIFSDKIAADNLNVEIVLEVRAEELVVENGRVTGVKGTGTDGNAYTFTANKGVVLATGGFGANVEMREKYNTIWPTLNENIGTTNGPAAVGDGIFMAEAVGAAFVGMEYIQLMPSADPKDGTTSMAIGGNMTVNKNGERFVDERERRDVLAAANLQQPDGIHYSIASTSGITITAEGYNHYGLHIDDLVKQQRVYRADTLEDLAAQINIPADALLKTVEAFNKAVDDGYDPLTGRTVFTEKSRIDTEGPYYATPLKPAVHHTMGGVKINTEAQVQDANGSTIPGLYAAGEVTGGIHGTNRLGGNAVSDALAFGQVAGRNAAAAQ